MRIFVVDRYSIITVCLVLILVAIVLPMGIFDSTPASSGANRELPIYSVETEEKVVSITFDSAWNDRDIDDIIKILEKYECTATFFATGEWIDKYPEAAKNIVKAGHELANHSNTHAHFNNMSASDMKKDMDECDKKILETTGRENNLFRAPYGEYNDKLIAVCRETGRYCIQWNIDSLDWKELSTEQILDRILPKLKNGSILLFHNGTENTAKALPQILESIKGRGYSFKPVGELIYKENYKINHEGRQIKNS